MTRKDYVLLAEALNRSEAPYADGEMVRRSVAECIADALARDNPRFDRHRFLVAAGVQS